MGTVKYILKKGSTPPDRQHAGDDLSDEEITRAALADTDNPPFNEEELAHVALAREVQAIRGRRKLSQEGFAARYGIPLHTLRGWERGRLIPDQPALSYLRVIDALPDEVAGALVDG